MNKLKICLIGSGIGIGSLIEKIEPSQFERVTIVEAGRKQPLEGAVLKDNIGREFGVRTTTAIQVGGTSNLWHGVLSPLAPDDFEVKEHIKYSGWPISYSDIEPYYLQAAEILGIDQYSRFFPNHLDENVKPLLKDVVFNKAYLENKIFQQPLPIRNFRESVLNFCANHANVELLTEHVALELIISSGSAKALKVGRKDGSISIIESDLFIVGAGALETPRLLLNSKLSNNNIGRFLMDHPMGNLCQLEFLKPQKAPLYSDVKLTKTQKIKSGLVMKEDLRKKLQLLNHNFYLRPSFIKGIDDESEKVKLSLLAFKDRKATFKDIRRVITSINTIRQILIYKLSLNVKFRFADLFFVAEQRPNPDSRITLSEKRDKWGYPIAKINWQVLPEDIDDIKRWFKLMVQEFFPKDKYCFTHRLEDFNWEEIYTSAIHHVGTARMSKTPDFGVVDENLKVHGIDNLYICDGSVFTTSGNVNSSFTISALACRLTEYLSKREVL